MITAQPQPSFDSLITQLEAQAEALAVAGAQNAQLAQGADPLRWRQASLVWPLFTASLMKKG
jgi:hypothetical protein